MALAKLPGRLKQPLQVRQARVLKGRRGVATRWGAGAWGCVRASGRGPPPTSLPIKLDRAPGGKAALPAVRAETRIAAKDTQLTYPSTADLVVTLAKAANRGRILTLQELQSAPPVA